MIKGIQDHNNTEWLRVIYRKNRVGAPTIRLSKGCNSSLPKDLYCSCWESRHYVWEPTWKKAKIHAESYEYLFKEVLKMHKYNIKIKETESIDRAIRSWLIDEERLKTEDLRNKLQHKHVKWISSDEISN